MLNREFSLLFLLGFLLEIVCLGVVFLGDLRTNAAWFIPIYLSSFLPYFLSIYVIKKALQSKKTLLILLLFYAITFRITLFFSPPTLSDDIYRYLWDGWVGRHGINPYCYPPNSHEIAWLRDIYYPGINHKHIPTIYPPFMQIVFTLADKASHSINFMKSVFIIFDLLTLFIIYKILVLKDKNPLLILIYAWNPLILIEFSSSAHNDSLAIFLLVLSLYLLLLKRSRLSIISLSLSFLSKYLAVLFLPLFWKKVDKKDFIFFPLIVIFLYLPYLSAGKNLFTGLFTYARYWRFNDSIFSILYFFTGSLFIAKAIGALFLLGLLSYLTLKEEDPLRSCYLLISCSLLLSPTLHPWYLSWIIPFLCLYPNRSWLLLSGLVGISYYVLIDYANKGIWQESLWIKALEFIPFYILLIFDWIRRPKLNESSI
jgi:hypothetical protein